jgi:Methyltransferase FkbM domain
VKPNNGTFDRSSLNKAVLRPIEYPDMIRLGTKGDGGYVVPRNQVENCRLLISLGLSDNWDFDREFLAINPTARVIGVDHTIGKWWFMRRILVYSWKTILYLVIHNKRKRNKYVYKLKNCLAYFSFFRLPNVHLKKKVSSDGGKSSIRLDQILDANSTQDAIRDVLLKMDIEGAEYQVAQDIIRCEGRIRIITAEFHDLDSRTEDFNKSVESLLQYFFIVHVHGNNGACYDQRNNFPSVAEITFLNKSLLSLPVSFSTTGYPREGLDFPNNPNASEYTLHFE